jgi:hypothetical protein
VFVILPGFCAYLDHTPISEKSFSLLHRTWHDFFMIDNSSTLSGFEMSNPKEFIFCTFQRLSVLIFLSHLNYKSLAKKGLYVLNKLFISQICRILDGVCTLLSIVYLKSQCSEVLKQGA